MAQPRGLRLTVDFTGSHDDTVLSLSAFLEEQEVACEPGSKTRSTFEDGNVSLLCLYTVAPSSAEPPGFWVVASIHHAQYTG